MRRRLAVVTLTALIGIFVAGPAPAQTRASVAGIALVECRDNGSTYRTGMLVTSNEAEAVVIVSSTGSACHAPLVTLAGDARPAEGVKLIVPFNQLGMGYDLLAIDRPLAAVAHLDLAPLAKPATYLLTGFPISFMLPGRPNAPVTAPATLTYSGTYGYFIDSTTTIDSAFVVDQQSGDIAGFAVAYAPDFAFGKPPTTRYSAQSGDKIAALLKLVNLVPGTVHLSSAQLSNARLSAAVQRSTFPVFRDSGYREGFAVALGNTPAATLLILYATVSGAQNVGVRDRSGATHMLPATVLASDDRTPFKIVSVAKTDVVVPTFAPPPAAGSTIDVEVARQGSNCRWDGIAPAPDACRMDVNPGQLTTPLNPSSDTLGTSALLNTTTDVTIGAPALNPVNGTIFGLATQTGIVPLTDLVQRLRDRCGAACAVDVLGIGVHPG